MRIEESVPNSAGADHPKIFRFMIAKYLHAFVAILINGVAVKHMGR